MIYTLIRAINLHFFTIIHQNIYIILLYEAIFYPIVHSLKFCTHEGREEWSERARERGSERASEREREREREGASERAREGTNVHASQPLK